MSARAQLILKQLGISPWVERASATKHASATDIIANQMLWRDQSDDQGVENKKLPFTDQTMSVWTENQFVQNQSHKKTAPQTIVEDSEITHAFVKEEVIDTENDQNQILDEIMPIDAEAVQATIHFDYQVLIHESFLIFAHAENSAQHRLLQNIQKALSDSSVCAPSFMAFEYSELAIRRCASSRLFARFSTKLCCTKYFGFR